jgi:hypothetical protein
MERKYVLPRALFTDQKMLISIGILEKYLEVLRDIWWIEK